MYFDVIFSSLFRSDWPTFFGFFLMVVASWQAWRSTQSPFSLLALLAFAYAATGALLLVAWPQPSPLRPEWPSWLYPWFLANQRGLLMIGALFLVIALGRRRPS